MLRVRQGKGQPIRSDGPQSHLAKVGTPTMGGLMILTAIAAAMLLWMDFLNPYVWACLIVMAGFGPGWQCAPGVTGATHPSSSVAQWQSIRLLTGGL